MIQVYCNPKDERLVRDKLKYLKKRFLMTSISATIKNLIEKAWKQSVDKACKEHPNIPRGIIERSMLANA